MKRVHHDLILAWAAGATIQGLFASPGLFVNIWQDLETPDWDPDKAYRIKPVRRPNSVRIVGLYEPDGYEWKYLGQFRVTNGGDTNEVISIQVLE